MKISSSFLLAFSVGCAAQQPPALEERFHDVLLDHYNLGSSATFPLRYLLDRTHWAPGTPLWVYTGNEDDITSFANATGFMWTAAARFGGAIAFIEEVC